MERDATSSPLPGFRFCPTEQELVRFYLLNKLQNRRPEMERLIPVVNVYSYEPEELPEKSGEASVQDPVQWFFFCPRQEREAQGGRPTRTTRHGYWKATGSPSQVFDDNRTTIGKRKTMVFYTGRAPDGRKTAWKMNEYKAYDDEPSHPDEALKLRGEYSLCRVYRNSGSLRSFGRRPPLAATSGGSDGAGDLWSAAGGASTRRDGNRADQAPMVDGEVISHRNRTPVEQNPPAAGGEGDEDGDDTALGELDWDFLFAQSKELGSGNKEVGCNLCEGNRVPDF